MGKSKRVTVYFEPAIHKALRLRAATLYRSVSDVVNDSVRLSLAEDAADIEAFSARRKEKSVSFESIVTRVKHRAPARRPGGKPMRS